ncbi:transthyretin [Cheilinus undulatus]|uniref:transthyretin n=1 Tax=Cheilinus undulatus TaxID=241271 RepID=UPI001BD5DFDF|nr:transthyretin [Cheilinus undulatus]
MPQMLRYLFLASAVLLCNAAPTPPDRDGGSDMKCPLTVKILDAVKGTPAGLVALKVSQKTAEGGWTQITNGVTDANGEIHNLITEQQFPAGVYRVEFDTKTYWKSEGSVPFHEAAEVVFEAHAGGHRHYTLALLISPFSYTTAAVVSNVHQ